MLLHNYLIENMGSENKYTLEALFREIGEIKNMQTSNHTTVNVKLDNIQQNFESVKSVLTKHTSDIENLEYDKRRKNLIIFGVPENSQQFQQLDTLIISLVTNKLQINDFSKLELDFCRRIGQRKDLQKPRPIIMGLTTQRRKVEILKNSNKLKGSSITIQEDCPPEIRANNKNLLEEMKKLRKEGKYAAVRYGKLIVHDNRAEHVGNANTNKKFGSKRALSASPEDVGNKRMNHDLSSGTLAVMLNEESNQMKDSSSTPLSDNQLTPGQDRILTQTSISSYFPSQEDTIVVVENGKN